MAAGTSEYGTWCFAALRGLPAAILSRRGVVCLLPLFWVHGIRMLDSFLLPPVDGCCTCLPVPATTWEALRVAWQKRLLGFLVGRSLLPVWEDSHVPERLHWLQIRATLQCLQVISAAAQQNLKEIVILSANMSTADHSVDA